MISDNFIEPGWLDSVRGSIFYYPAAGDDTAEPIYFLKEVIQNFWFCDTHYDANLELPRALPKESGYDITLAMKHGVIGAEFEERTDNKGKTYKYLEPSRLTEEYQNDSSILTVHRRRGFGQIALSLEFENNSIGVFMHRGDSKGEGGSDCYFLANKKASFKSCNRLLDKLEVKLKDQAIIISDGSNSKIPWLSIFHHKDVTGRDAYLHHQFKLYQYGSYIWICIGWLGSRYGPTLLWGLRKISI